MEKSPGKRFLVTAGISLAVVALLGSAAFYFFFWRGSPGETKDILIPRGASAGNVITTLFDNGVIENKTAFKYLLRFTGGAKKLRAGEFRFQTKMRLIDAMFTLYHGDPVLHPVTIPEGYSAKQIAGLVAKAGLGSEQKFLAYVLDPETPKKYKLNTPTLEGFLFPETYAFSRIDGEERMADRMVNEFFKRFDAPMRAEAERIGFTVERLVTLASIVEKETGNADERALVSSVFHNRLKKKMRLESDPTIIYGIENFDGDIRYKDIKRAHPYNTYTIKALPPGPIASPGFATLQATLHPAETKFLFFVGNNTGRHLFSETYEQHLKYVDQYQRKRNPLPKTPATTQSKRDPKSVQRVLAGKKGKK